MALVKSFICVEEHMTQVLNEAHEWCPKLILKSCNDKTVDVAELEVAAMLFRVLLLLPATLIVCLLLFP